MAIGAYIDNDNPDGSVLGRSGGKIGFYGLSTPIVKPTITFAATSGSTVASSVAADLDTAMTGLQALGLFTFTRGT
jgi:hypothetical protein